ncbi:MAG: DUF4290 domain-containing protein [Cytophagaceae bacterium]
MEIPELDGIVLKEYGRNIQKLVDYVVKMPDRETRGKYAKTLIELMKQINPNMKDTQEYGKLWDHLYIMSNFELDVESPFPMPEKSVLGRKPMRVAYNTNQLYYKHYGKNIELLIDKAIKLDNAEDRDAAITYIGRLMKRFYASWNKENITDDIIIEQLTKMSKGQLKLDVEKIKSQNLFDSPARENRPSSNGGFQNRDRDRDRDRDNRDRDNRDRDRDRDGSNNKRQRFNKDKRKKN